MSNENRIRHWDEMGIERDKVFSVEAMEYWLQYPTTYFMQAMVHEVRDRLTRATFFLNWIYEDPLAASVVLAASGKYHKTVKDDCETILHYQEEMSAMLDLTWRYAEHLKSDDPAQE